MQLSARLRHAVLAAAFGLSCGAGAASQLPAQAVAPPDKAALEAYEDRVKAYLVLHEKVTRDLPPLKETEDPGKITEREQALGDAIKRARPQANPGDIFGDLSPYFREVIRRDWATRSKEARQGLAEDKPSGAVAMVNTTYPPLPLATFPPALLKVLPPLPEHLEYRFVGRHLIMRDVRANLIVDVLRDVLPGDGT